MKTAGVTKECPTPWSLVLNKDLDVDEIRTYLGHDP